MNRMKGNDNKEKRCSEEISDIVDRMPMAFGKIVAWSVVLFTALLLLFGWIIRYPDTVTGQIKINSSNSMVKMVANASGNILLSSYRAQDEVNKGEYIAIIENPAVTEDVRKVIALTARFHSDEPVTDSVRQQFPVKVSLGDLTLKYYTFLSALENQCDYTHENIYEKQRIALSDNIRWKETILEETNRLLRISQKKLELSRKWLEKDITLNKKTLIAEYDIDKSMSEYLSIEQEEQNLRIEKISIGMQITENRNQLNRLSVEQKEKEHALRMDLVTAYQDLAGNLKTWEQTYVFKAPFDGKVEFLKFISENQFVQAGEEIFGIVPKETNIFGQMLLPASGAGKVKLGSPVTIKLDNYPYMEYGIVQGTVTSISMLSQVQKTEQNTLNTYLVVVELPDGLTSNYGEKLDFQYEIGGTADIIVNERRLIERLFDNLKYRTR